MKFPLPQRSPLRAHPCILAVARGATAGAGSCIEQAGDFRFGNFASPDNEAFSSFQFEESGNSLSIYLLLPILARPMSRGYGSSETTSLFWWSRPFDYGKDCTHGFDAVIHTSLRACTISNSD